MTSSVASTSSTLPSVIDPPADGTKKRKMDSSRQDREDKVDDDVDDDMSLTVESNKNSNKKRKLTGLDEEQPADSAHGKQRQPVAAPLVSEQSNKDTVVRNVAEASGSSLRGAPVVVAAAAGDGKDAKRDALSLPNKPKNKDEGENKDKDKDKGKEIRQLMNERYHVDFNDEADTQKDPRLIHRGYALVCATSTNGVTLQKLFIGLKTVLSKAPITFSNGGISLSAIDNNNVAMILVKLKAKKFENYYCPDDIELKFNMASFASNFEDLQDGANQTLTIKCNSTDRLQFDIDSPESGGQFSYTEKCIEDEVETMPPPKLQMPYSAKFPVSVLTRAVRILGKKTDAEMIRIVATNSAFEFWVGDNYHRYVRTQANEMGFEKDNTDDELKIDEQFSLVYLSKFEKIMSKLKHDFVISMEKKMPLVLRQPIAGLGHIKFILAPNVDDDAGGAAPPASGKKAGAKKAGPKSKKEKKSKESGGSSSKGSKASKASKKQKAASSPGKKKGGIREDDYEDDDAGSIDDGDDNMDDD